MSHDWYKYYPAGVEREINLAKEKSIADALETACKKYESLTALTCMGTDMTYRELDRLANQFASYLQHKVGLKKGDRLALMLPNIIQFPIAFFAAQKIGVICVNTNPLYTPREMRHQFKDSGAKAIVILDMVAPNLTQIIADTDIKTVVITGIGDQLPAWKGFVIGTGMKVKGMVKPYTLPHTSFKDALRQGAEKPHTAVDVNLDDIAVLQYTGGTTGISKGAMLLQRNILANMLQIRNIAKIHVKEGSEQVLTAIPLYHIFALSVNFLSFLAMGERMILVPKPVPVSNLNKIFAKYQITVMTGVNTLFNALAHDAGFQKNPPRSLKIALGGGMAVQEAVNKHWQKLTGNAIVEGFGLTESSPVTHVNPLDEHLRIGSVGIPVASTDAKCVDAEGKEVPLGEAGELLVKGPQVMAGYWKRDDETAKTLKNGWLYTGDIAKRDADGFFYIVDRKKDMILVSGFNVFPNEIEEVLVSHPKVLEAAVVGVPDATSGEAVKAFVVAKDPSLTVDELKKYCVENLTNYKRPRQFELRKSLPKSNIGKILRRELRDGGAQAEAAPKTT